MRNVREKITKERYQELSELSKWELHIQMEKEICPEWRWGYGWNGCYLKEENGEYFVVHKIGSHCD